MNDSVHITFLQFSDSVRDRLDDQAFGKVLDVISPWEPISCISRISYVDDLRSGQLLDLSIISHRGKNQRTHFFLQMFVELAHSIMVDISHDHLGLPTDANLAI